MKNTLIYVSLILFLATTNTASSQEYIDQLAPVYLTSTPLKAQASSPIDTINTLLLEKEISLKKSIRQAKKKPEDIVIFSDDTIYIIDKHTYLKVIKKAANKEDSLGGFIASIETKYPVISDALIDFYDLKAFYDVLRDQTFEGSLDQLPSGLQWI